MIKKTLNPEWDETLEFDDLTLGKVLQTPLLLHAYDKDGALSLNDSLGELSVSLERLQAQESVQFEQRLSKQGTLQFSVHWVHDP